MIQIKFNNEEKFINCTTFRRINMNVVMLDFNSSNTNGFATYKDTQQLGDFSDYTTIYKKENGYTYFSNDGSKWIEPNRNIIFDINWNCPDSITLPDSIALTIKSDEDIEKTITVTKENQWSYNFTCLQHENYRIISTEEVTDFNYVISDDSVDYTYTKPVATWQDKIEAQLTYTALCTDTLLEE